MKTLLLLFFPLIANSQIDYKGSVINKLTKEKIPYATVGIIKQNIGTNADQNGNFTLRLGNNKDDTLIISCVGYETSKFPVDNLPLNLQFEISEKQIELRNFIVKSYKYLNTLNDFSNCGFNFYTSSGSVTQIALRLYSPVENSLLSKINICKAGDNSLFRVRVYDIDSISGKPSIDLVDTIIEVKSGKRHVQINLEKYNIIVPHKDFFIGIEWLYIPSNESIVKMKKDGQKIRYSQYSPFISFKNHRTNNDNFENSSESWYLDYRKKWIRNNSDWIFLISAEVKY